VADGQKGSFERVGAAPARGEMSSIQEAIYKDTRRNRGQQQNFVALTNKQERENGRANDEYHERLAEKRMEERKRREAEGGVGGGYNDRAGQVVTTRNMSAEVCDGFDDFGRRRVAPAGGRGAAGAASRTSRAQAALERLRLNAVKRVEGSGAARSTAEAGPRQELSRSPPDRPRSPKATTAPPRDRSRSGGAKSSATGRQRSDSRHRKRSCSAGRRQRSRSRPRAGGSARDRSSRSRTR